MTRTSPSITSPAAALDYDSTLLLAVEISNKSWVVGAQVPGLARTKAKQTVTPTAVALLAAIDGYKRRAQAAGRAVRRVIVVYEAGYSGFWLARWLLARGVEVHVVQPASVPVDRRVRRAKSDAIDVDLLLRTLLAWLRGEPRVCSMVPIPSAAAEDARRPGREREILLAERLALTNRVGAILATLGAAEYEPLHRDRRARLAALRTAQGEPLPPHAKAQIERLLARLELVLEQIAELEHERNAVLRPQQSPPQTATGAAETDAAAVRLIQSLARLRGIGPQLATLLVREGFVREFRKRRWPPMPG